MHVWCQGCNNGYESEMRASECPFCHTFNYSGIEEGENELSLSNDN